MHRQTNPSILAAALLTLLLTASGAAVADEPEFAQGPPPRGDKLLVYFYRLPSSSLAMRGAEIMVDGKKLFGLASGEYSYAYLSPGPHMIGAEEGRLLWDSGDLSAELAIDGTFRRNALLARCDRNRSFRIPAGERVCAQRGATAAGYPPIGHVASRSGHPGRAPARVPAVAGAVSYSRSGQRRRRALAEMHRVLKPGGRFLLITEVNHEPTLAEPNCILPEELAALIECKFDFLSRGLYRVRDDHNVYQSVRDAAPVETPLVPNVPAIFTAHCMKR